MAHELTTCQVVYHCYQIRTTLLLARSWQLASAVLQLVMGDTNSKDARIWLLYSFRCLVAKVSISCGSRRCNWLAARMRKTDRYLIFIVRPYTA
jgi:hypothetical protein